MSYSRSCQNFHHSILATFDSVCNLKIEPEEHEESPPTRAFFIDERGRFGVWAKNVGAHKHPNSKTSLEYRLREAPHVHSTLFELLRNLENSIIEGLKLLRQSPADQDPNMPIGESIEDLLAYDSESEESEDDTDAQNDNGQGVSDLEYVCSDISGYIDALYRLSMLIRNPATPSKTHKYGAIDVSHFKLYERQRIQNKYETELPRFLAERLVQANLKRRQIFSYSSTHQAKIAASNRSTAKLTSDERIYITGDAQAALSIAPTTAVLSETTATKLRESSALIHMTALGDVTAPRQTTSFLDGIVPTKDTLTPFCTSAMSEDGASETSSMAASVLSSEVGDSGGTRVNIRIPMPPGIGEVLQKTHSFLECPFCFRMIRIRSRKHWRKHVLSDLQPYMCTFEHCAPELADRLFATQSEWYNHELQFHRREWFCCKASCGDRTFGSINMLVQHLKMEHQEEIEYGDNESDPSPLLLLQCERESTVNQRCPFCITSANFAPHLLRAHLGRHLIDFALFALPQQHHEDTDVQPPSEDGDNRSFESSLVFEEDELQKNEEDEVQENEEKESMAEKCFLASVYEKQGSYSIALELYQQALVLCEKNPEVDHEINGLSIMCNIASIYKNQGRYDIALEWYNRALAGMEKQLGADHPHTLTTVHNIAEINRLSTMCNIASTYENQGKYDEALGWYDRVLSEWGEQLGVNHPKILTTVHNMASIFNKQGRYDIALEWYNRALAGMEKQLGVDHPHTLTTVHNIALVSYIQGKYDRALEWYGRVLRAEEKQLGVDHPNTLTTLHNMALILVGQSQYDIALEWYNRALAGMEKQVGADHPGTLTTVHNIALVFYKQGKYEMALDWYKRAFAGREKQLGADHPNTLTTAHNMASVFDMQGKYDMALEWYTRALAGIEKRFGVDHPGTLTTVHNIALVFYNQGKYELALEWYHRLLVGNEKQLGADHFETLTTVHNIACVHFNQGVYETALVWYQRALAGREKQLGANHRDTQSTVERLKMVYQKLGMSGAAEELR